MTMYNNIIKQIWNKDITIGEMLGNKNTFYSAIFAENFNSIIAYTYNGSFYLWRYGMLYMK